MLRAGAKGRKNLTKKKTDYQYYAPRYKDGVMVDGNKLMEEKRLQDRRTNAATNIQKTFRGEKSRNKYDMKSKWYKGFPTNPPEEVPDLEVNSRLADMAIQGFNTRTSREALDDKEKENYNKYMHKLNTLGKKDELKYSWGKYYDKYDYHKPITEGTRRFIDFEKKNYDKLKDIAKKRIYWSKQLDKNKPLEHGKKRYDPNNAMNTERYIIRDLAGEYYGEDIDKVDQWVRRYYEGEYYDQDIDNFTVMPNYEVGELPKLSPIDEQDEEYYEEGDELLLPYHKAEEAVEYYNSLRPKEVEILNEYKKDENLLLKEYEELDKKRELDIEKCLHAKKLANIDIKLYQDKYFMENYYEPCSDNERLTDIYIDTFYSLPWQLIKPAEITIEGFLYNIPSIYLNREDEVSGWKNAFITEPGVQIFRNILQDQGLLKSYYGAGAFSDDPPFVDFHYLSNYYRWAVDGHTRIRHLRNMPIFRGNKSGKEYLRETFRRLDEAFEAPEPWHDANIAFTLNGRINKSILNIEKFKRYFILNLIGLIGNPEYPNILSNFIDTNKNILTKSKNILKEVKEKEKEAIQALNNIISKYENEDIDKFIKEYKDGLLGGLDDHDDNIMHISISTLELIEPEIINMKKKIEKIEKDLDTAIRFSKITFTEKNYSTFEYEKLIYE